MLTRKPDPAPGVIAIPPFARDFTLTHLSPQYDPELPTFTFMLDRAGRTMQAHAWSSLPGVYALMAAGRDHVQIPNGAEYIGVVAWSEIDPREGEEDIPGTREVLCRFNLHT